MIFPGAHSIKSVETIFVDGLRFDICEVAEHHFCYITSRTGKPQNRYFLDCEGTIMFYNYAVEYHAATGQCRWDFFTRGKSDLKKEIAQFEERYKTLESLRDKLANKPAMAGLLQPKIDWIASCIKERYGINI